MRLAIITSRATSLKEVGRGIAYVARAKGFTPIIMEYAPSPVDLKNIARLAIIVMTMNPLLSRSYFVAARDYNINNIPAWIYTTTEGRLPRRYVKKWMQRDLSFIANSEYTREKLEEAGLQVIDVIPHGYIGSDIEKAIGYRETGRSFLEEKLGKGVIFVTVASGLRRKGHPLLADAISMAINECNDCRFFVLTTPDAYSYYQGLEGKVYVDTRFGELSRIEVLSIMAAADWYIQPSLAEGFGLPVLEAQALGTPCIHVDYAPLNEHSCPCNIRVPWYQIVYDPQGEGIEYELHMYKPEEMAKAILRAYDITVNNSDEYKDISEKVRKHAEQFEAKKVYSKFFDNIIVYEEIG